ncbi:SIALI-17 repeat-containing surface protein, partial [Streptococcus sp. CCUG 49591]
TPEPVPTPEPEVLTSKGNQEPPVVEIPEFTGGVNAAEAAVNEVPEYKGGANAVEALVHELPEYKGGANAVEALVNEKPAYTGLLATAGDQAAPTIEKPEYQISQLGQGKLAESKTSVSTEDKKRLPETGESQSDTAIFLASISLALSAAVLATKRKEN